MDPREASTRIEQLRRYRVRAPPTSEAAATFKRLSAGFAKLRRAMPAVGEAWEELCPSQLAACVRVEGVSRGTLRLRVDDSASASELRAALRSGLEDELIRRSPLGVNRVKVVVGGV